MPKASGALLLLDVLGNAVTMLGTVSTPKVAPYFPDAPPLAFTTYRMPLHADVSPRTPAAPVTSSRSNRTAVVAKASAKATVTPSEPEPTAAPPPDAAELAVAADRRDLYERWSRPLLGFGFPAFGRGLLVAYPHRVGYALWAGVGVSVIVHAFGGSFFRPTVMLILGTALVAADRISLKLPWLRLLAYFVAVAIGLVVDEATRNTLFKGWDR